MVRVSKKVSVVVSKKFGIDKSILIRIGKIWYRKKYRIRYRKKLVSEKSFVQILGSCDPGLGGRGSGGPGSGGRGVWGRGAGVGGRGPVGPRARHHLCLLLVFHDREIC